MSGSGSGIEIAMTTTLDDDAASVDFTMGERRDSISAQKRNFDWSRCVELNGGGIIYAGRRLAS